MADVGDVVEVRAGDVIPVQVPRYFIDPVKYHGVFDKFESVDAIVGEEPFRGFRTDFLVGHWIVAEIKRVSTGGGHNEIETFENRCLLRKVDSQSDQMWLPRAVVDDLPVVGEAECVWRWTKKPVDLM